MPKGRRLQVDPAAAAGTTGRRGSSAGEAVKGEDGLVRRSGIHLWGIDEAVRQDLLERAVRKENLPGVGTAAGQAGPSPGPTGRGPIWTGSLGGHEAV
ncbi:MAG: hypothetical protein ACE5ID_07175, partial [Acidobacteriota bacterium]